MLSFQSGIVQIIRGFIVAAVVAILLPVIFLVTPGALILLPFVVLSAVLAIIVLFLFQVISLRLYQAVGTFIFVVVIMMTPLRSLVLSSFKTVKDYSKTSSLIQDNDRAFAKYLVALKN